MSLEINYIKDENSENESSSKSNGIIYMDMKVYSEDEETLDNFETKEKNTAMFEEQFEEEKNDQDENLPLTSIKILPNQTQDDSLDSKTQCKRKKKMSGSIVQKENILGNKKGRRYKLRNRTVSKSYNCSKCCVTFQNKPDITAHKSQLKCSFCSRSFCSNFTLSQHLNKCKGLKARNGGVCLSGDSSVFKCIKCSNFFRDQNDLQSHLVQCNGSNMYTCDVCKKMYARLNSLRKHITTHLNSKKCLNCCSKFENEETHKCCTKQNSCYFCGKKFVQRTQLKIHLLQHEGIIHKCDKCKKLFASKHSLANHACSMSIHKCPKCGKISKDEVSFRKHLESHKDRVMKCRICNKVFIDSSKFSGHVAAADCQRLASDKSKAKYECDPCGVKFLKLVKLKIHVLNVHQGIDYNCEKCGCKFVSEEERDVHVEKQDCKSEEPCTCKICGKLFAKRDYLKKHHYMHSNVLFKCKYCYCAFMKEKNYKRHMEKMNCSKSARKIKMSEYNFRKCRICQVEYENEEILIEHFKNSHPGDEPHQCFCCESCLPTFKDLQNHIHHHNTQKYTCNLCGKPYTSQEGFRKHRLKHKGAEFKCKYCDSEFLNETRFKFHEKTCKKNPESGYEEKNKPKKKDERPKQSRQLHWESRIIIKRTRGDPQASAATGSKSESSVVSKFFDEPETETTTSERGWFDNYYKTEEDDIAFGVTRDEETTAQDCDDSDYDVSEPFLKPRRVEEIENSESSSSGSSLSSEEEEDIEVELPIDYNPKKCRLCLITFAQEYELLHHFIKSHSGEHAHKCPKCEVQSPLFAQLKEHMKEHGIGIGVYNCDNCSKKFKSEKKLKNHNIRCKGMNVENGMGEIKEEIRCKKCGKTFQTKVGYRRHKQLCKRGKKNKNKKTVRLTKVKEDLFEPVPDDNDTSNYISDPEEEIKTTKPNREKTNDNEIVENGKILESKKPEAKDAYPGEPPLDSFPCRLCDKKFQYERGIVMHFKSSHPGHKPLICHVCNMHLADKLKEHLKTHGIGEEFICELCGKRFNQKFLSKIHEMWHQGIEYKCDNCKQKFLNKEKMDKHIRESRCSNRQSLMRLPCDICGKSYRSKFGLSKHYITHTPKELRPVKNRMNCEYCGKWFENNNGLERHRRIHTGERPFCCRFCPKAFAQEGNCKAHEKIHTGESKPRKKKQQPSLFSQQQVLPPPVPPPLPPVATQVSVPIHMPQTVLHSHSVASLETVSYPGHINSYIYNTIDSSGTAH